MARASRLIAQITNDILLRMAAPEFDQLWQLVKRRYPDEEWATFVRFGWRRVGEGLVITLAHLDRPVEGDLDATVAHVALREQYTLRTALNAENHRLAVGVVHSHPHECAPIASHIDDDMDAYYARYFADFAPMRPYVSLILSELDGELAISGRVNWNGRWHAVTRVSAASATDRPPRVWVGDLPSRAVPRHGKRSERFSAAFGDEATARLRRSTVAVIGAGGTGSAAIEVLARAGIGRLVIVDADVIEESNLERIHGSVPEDADSSRLKVEVAKRHVASIDPTCEVVAIAGMIPQDEVVDALCTADAAIGCTDSHSSRLALSDLAFRYLIPSFDCGVALEGKMGRVSGQIIQLTRFFPDDPCALCRGMTSPVRVAQELMSAGERASRRIAAQRADNDGANGDAYWRELPQLNTVGYLTTAAGALVAGYTIGFLAHRFGMPLSRLQMNLVAPYLEVVDADTGARFDCTCRFNRGAGDQGAIDAYVGAPSHWTSPRMIA